jgi:hypothetical protein
MTLVVRITWACAIVLLCAVWLRAEPNRPRITADGTDGFRALLAQAGLKPVGPTADLKAKIEELGGPKNFIIIWFRGTNSFGEPLPDGLESLNFDLKTDFVVQGGALWMATDQPLPTTLSRAFHAAVEETVILARRNVPSYRNKIECPYIHGLDGVQPDLFTPRRNPTQVDDAAAVRRLIIATNRPSFLTASSELTTLGVFRQREWRYPSNFSELRDLPVVQAGTYGPDGRVLLLSDHSIFINCMLLPQEPNDNLAFAINCLQWLQQTSDGTTRSYVVFMEDGRIWAPSDYDLMLRSLPTPTPENVAQFLWDNRNLVWENLDLAEDVMARLEEDGVLAEIEIQDLLGQLVADAVNMQSLRRLLFLTGAIIAAAIASRAWVRVRQRYPLNIPRLVMAIDQCQSSRDSDGALSANLVAPALKSRWVREKARALLARLQSRDEPTPDLSTIPIESGWWRRREILRHLRRVRHFAFAAPSEIVETTELETLTRSIESLSEWMDQRMVGPLAALRSQEE